MEDLAGLNRESNLLELVQSLSVLLSCCVLAFTVDPIDRFNEAFHEGFTNGRVDVSLIGPIGVDVVLHFVGVTFQLILDRLEV